MYGCTKSLPCVECSAQRDHLRKKVYDCEGALAGAKTGREESETDRKIREAVSNLKRLFPGLSHALMHSWWTTLVKDKPSPELDPRTSLRSEFQACQNFESSIEATHLSLPPMSRWIIELACTAELAKASVIGFCACSSSRLQSLHALDAWEN